MSPPLSATGRYPRGKRREATASVSRPRLWIVDCGLRIEPIHSLFLLALLPVGCNYSVDSTTALLGPFNNPSDPTNGGAAYIGSAACAACHADVAALNALHGHTQALKAVLGAAPEYPSSASRAGVPNPPTGQPWSNVSYVLGGYRHGGLFVDRDGFLMTDGILGVQTQWYLNFPPNGTAAAFAPYLLAQAQPLAYSYECFRCHVTGPQPQDPLRPLSQEGRPGILGTWAEPGVQCEACHGPGSNHAPNPWVRRMFVDSTNETCARCHLEGDDPAVIAVIDGYLSPNTQIAELRASGGHAAFNCGVCHSKHASATYDRRRGILNECTVCHGGVNLPFHEGVTFVRGDYSEPITCESCHMPFAGRSNSAGGPAAVGTNGGRMGDVRTHIFRIDTSNETYAQMFSADGSRVVKDALDRAAVTPDFACLRCHNGTGNAFIISPYGATVIGTDMHKKAANGTALQLPSSP